MNSFSPKQREIRDRELRILQLARNQLMSTSDSGLAWEAIAAGPVGQSATTFPVVKKS